MFTFGEPIPAVIEELKKFYDNLPGIEITAVVSVEGLPISSYPENLPQGADATRVAAMTAAMLALGERAMLEVGYQELDRILVEGPKGNLITISAGSKAVLTVTAKKSLKIGLLFFDMKKTADVIGKILENMEI